MRNIKSKIKQSILFIVFLFAVLSTTQWLLSLQIEPEVTTGLQANLSSLIEPSTAELALHPNDPFSIEENHLFIPSLNVGAPIVTPSKNDRTLIGDLMNDGVVHDLLSAPFGFQGNTVIFGHSSSDVYSDYQDVFAPLAHIKQGDDIEVFSDETKYIYRVKEMLVVDPTDNWITEHEEDEKLLTVYTCFPPGSDKDRLTIKAELVDESD